MSMTAVAPTEPVEARSMGEVPDENAAGSSTMPGLIGEGEKLLIYVHIPEKETEFGELTAEKTIPLNVKSSDTVESIKNKVQDELRISPMVRSKQRLLLMGKPLLEGLTLEACEVENETTLEVEDDMSIHIEISTEREIALDVFPSDTVLTVKSMVQDKELIPLPVRIKQFLLLDGKRLKDTLTLQECGVGKGMTIQFDDGERPPPSPTRWLILGVVFLTLGMILFLICLILCCA
eukprot:TRINITY_DN1050_c0_g1_i3.p2 TRINITY_DN1050_c0_g1~~TRINITY_DN1050_c0_g1_i3.p2  ORF type:complete len:235 (-),score=47.72 TRINITY_DN1050_c0_g1_i3:993-1697(-)